MWCVLPVMSSWFTELQNWKDSELYFHLQLLLPLPFGLVRFSEMRLKCGFVIRDLWAWSLLQYFLTDWYFQISAFLKRQHDLPVSLSQRAVAGQQCSLHALLAVQCGFIHAVPGHVPFWMDGHWPCYTVFAGGPSCTLCSASLSQELTALVSSKCSWGSDFGSMMTWSQCTWVLWCMGKI